MGYYSCGGTLLGYEKELPAETCCELDGSQRHMVSKGHQTLTSTYHRYHVDEILEQVK